jgi:predicted nucleic acid-binding protein
MSDWRTVEQWAVTAAEKGQQFGVMDLLIAATAEGAGARIWSLDSDFKRMERLKFVQTFDGG